MLSNVMMTLAGWKLDENKLIESILMSCRCSELRAESQERLCATRIPQTMDINEKEMQEKGVARGEGVEKKLIVNGALFHNLSIQIHEFQIRRFAVS